MSKPAPSIVLAALTLAASTIVPAAETAYTQPPLQDTELETVLITAQRTDRVSRGATGLDLDIKDTPQSISVVTGDLIQDFGIDDLNTALRLATGISVEEWETNRTNYLARGFEIKSTQIDGVGLPNDWGIVTGAMDSYGYEKLEVIRGANGLLTGVGNSSGTINFVRKRPTNFRQGELSASAGSWDNLRIEGDYSTPLTASGSWAGRVVAAVETSDSYLRGLKNDRRYVYGVIDGQIGDRLTAAFGYSYQEADTDGNMWGALVLAQTDGAQAEFERGVSPTQDWTYWNTTNHSAFAELGLQLGDNWSLRGSYNFRKTLEEDQLFYIYGVLDPDTMLGTYGWPGKYAGSTTSHLGDLALNGSFDAFGRQHELMAGVSQANSANTLDNWEVDVTEPAFGAMPAFPYAGDAVPEPAWGARGHYSHYGQWMRRAYGATRLNVTDRVKVIAGFNQARFHRQGIDDTATYWEQTQNKFSPYAGLTVNITADVLAYASYSDIFQPQDQYDIDGVYLDPAKGENVEVGAKANWLDNRLLTTLAWFSSSQKGLSTFAGIDDGGMYYYRATDVDSQGFEFEAAGRLSRNTDLLFGFTSLKLDGDEGSATNPWVSRRTANLSLRTQVPGLPQVRAGLNGRWQNGFSAIDSTSGVTLHQSAYAVINLFGQWQFNDQISVSANVNNVGNEKFLTSLYSGGYYGPGRNYLLGFDWKF